MKNIAENHKTDILGNFCDMVAIDGNSPCGEWECSVCPLNDVTNLGMAIAEFLDDEKPSVQQQAFYDDSLFERNGERKGLKQLKKDVRKELFRKLTGGECGEL